MDGYHVGGMDGCDKQVLCVHMHAMDLKLADETYDGIL